jgi:hypothetical protein
MNVNCECGMCNVNVNKSTLVENGQLTLQCQLQCNFTFYDSILTFYTADFTHLAFSISAKRINIYTLHLRLRGSFFVWSWFRREKRVRSFHFSLFFSPFPFPILVNVNFDVLCFGVASLCPVQMVWDSG